MKHRYRRRMKQQWYGGPSVVEQGAAREEVQPLDADDFAALDPGIRRTVAWLRECEFQTTDSSDGITKPARGDDEAMTVPHVAIVVHKHELIVEADRLAVLLEERGHPPQSLSPKAGDTPEIQATYDPANQTAVIVLLGVNDALLFGAEPAGQAS